MALDATFGSDLARMRAASASSVRDREHAADRAVDGAPTSFWAAADVDVTPSLELDLGVPRSFNRLCLQEAIGEGQRVAEYALEAWDGGAWKEIARGTTVGYKKLDRFGTVRAQRVRLVVRAARAAPMLQAFSLYHAPHT